MAFPVPKTIGPSAGAPTGGGGGFDPLSILSGKAGGGVPIPSLTGGDAGPSRSDQGDQFASTGIFQVGRGNSASQPTSAGAAGAGFTGDQLILVALIGGLAWILVSALR